MTNRDGGRLSLLDATFLHIETRDTPMHVASLQTFALPEDAPADFVHGIVAHLRRPEPLVAPWNLRLAPVPLSRVAPAVETTQEIDLDYHVRHTALPAPGGQRQLGELVSHLHSQILDRSRPLWTCHVIEGLEGNRFAVYLKVHHCLTDGVNGIRMVEQSLSTTPTGPWSGPWHASPDDESDPDPDPPSRSRAPRQRVGPRERVSALARGVRGLARRDDGEPVRWLFQSPRSALNGRVTAARRVATQQLDLQRVKDLARRADASVNDVFLAVCSSALRRHLLDLDGLPERPLVAAVPVNLRMQGEVGGNAVGFVWASLATDETDDLARLAAIRASMQAAKDNLQSMPAPVRPTFSMLTMTPGIVVLFTGLGARVRPPMNLTISNVPGPRQPLYANGARLEALYPVSLPLQGQALNITCISYDGKLNVGFTGSRDGLPHLQRIAVHTAEALDHLEEAVTSRPLPGEAS